MKTTRSEKLFKEACELIPGGVNSPVRACLGVGADPLFIASAKGSHVTTVDGQEMIDFVESWGPMLLRAFPSRGDQGGRRSRRKGHQLRRSLSRRGRACPHGRGRVPRHGYGAHGELGHGRRPGSALRLARGVTGRTKVLKFIGCYHGHADPFLASAGSGVATLSIPGTPGVPESTVRDTLLAPYNDVRAVEDIFHLYGKDIAAIIVEPIAGNMGLVLPEEGFLKALRALCDTHGALLIMDEVITGFRRRVRRGADPFRHHARSDHPRQDHRRRPARWGVRRQTRVHEPCGSRRGRVSGRDAFRESARHGRGIATLSVLKASDYAALEARVEAFAAELESILRGKGVPVTVNRLASMYTVFFSDGPLRNFEDVKNSDTEMYSRFFRAMRERNIFVAPSAFEVAMVSFAHTEEDFAKTLDAVRDIRL